MADDSSVDPAAAEKSPVEQEETQEMNQPSSDAAEETAAAFTPNDIVLAKLKGFPSWPGIVIPESFLPEDVKSKQPKKKDVYPVLFFNDNSYMWASEKELRILPVEEASKNAGKTKTKKALREAFRIASEQPTTEEYLQSQQTSVEVPEEEPAPKRAKKASEKPVSAPRSSRASTKAVKRKLEKDDDAVDEPGIIELKRPKQRGRPSGKNSESSADPEDLAKSPELRLELCKQARIRLQKGLLVDERDRVPLAQFSMILEQLEQVPNIEVAFVRVSKLNRVLRAIVDLQEPLKDEKKFDFIQRCQKLLKKWDTQADPIIRGWPEAEAQSRESEAPETPEDTPAELPTSEPDVKNEYTENGHAHNESSPDTKEESQPPPNDIKPEEPVNGQKSEPATSEELEQSAPPESSSAVDSAEHNPVAILGVSDGPSAADPPQQ